MPEQLVKVERLVQDVRALLPSGCLRRAGGGWGRNLPWAACLRAYMLSISGGGGRPLGSRATRIRAQLPGNRYLGEPLLVSRLDL
jgi:hypothetical protein